MDDNKKLAEKSGIRQLLCIGDSTLITPCCVECPYFDDNCGFKIDGYPDFKNPINTIKLQECLIKSVGTLTIDTDLKGNITTSWLDSETQLEEEYVDISKDLTEAIVKTALAVAEYPYIGDIFIKNSKNIRWSY